MTDAVIFSIDANLLANSRAAAAVLMRVFPDALTLPGNGEHHLQLAVPVSSILQEAPTDAVEDTDQAVLARLLYIMPANCAQEDYADILHRFARGEGTDGDRRVLQDAGLDYVLFSEVGQETERFLAVAKGHPAINEAFASTPWAANPFARIARVKGALPEHSARLIRGVTRRYVLIPWKVVADLCPECPY